MKKWRSWSWAILSAILKLLASKYMFYLPTEEELRRELERERRPIEEAQSEGEGSDQVGGQDG
jgi:hypothetical protein